MVSPVSALSVFSHLHQAGVQLSSFHSVLSLSALQRLVPWQNFQVFAAPYPCIPLLLRMSLGSYWMDLEASGIFLPLTHSLPLCPAARHCTLQKGESGWLLFLFWMLSHHTGAIQRKPGHRNPSLTTQRCRESNSIREP